MEPLNSPPFAVPPNLPRRTALFLDLDGTLAEIVARPDLARVPSETVEVLMRLYTCLDGAIAVLSGRELAQIDDLLAPLRLPAAGSHGAARRCSNGTLVRGEDASTALDGLVVRLTAFAAEHEGLLLERKAHGAALHYRARPELEGLARQTVQAALAGLSGVRLIEGKMVLEVLPAAHGKGHALAAFLLEPPFAGRVPVAIGDDVTDEDMFAECHARGGTAIKVGAGETVAAYRLADPAALAGWLADQAELLRLGMDT